VGRSKLHPHPDLERQNSNSYHVFFKDSYYGCRERKW